MPPPSTPPSQPRHPAVAAYLDALRASGKDSTAYTYGHYLNLFEGWMGRARLDLMHATTDQLAGYQLWLSTDRPARLGAVRARTTQGTAVITVKSLYAWLRKRGFIIHDPAKALVPPSTPRTLTVHKDHLTLQECTALIQTQAAMVRDHPADTSPSYRALEIRNLAMLCIALATGRRVHGLVALRLDQIDLERNEIRVEREKARIGRVLPIASFSAETVKRYLDEARPVLLDGAQSPWLFISQRGGALCTRAVSCVLDNAVQETIARNPDLTDLPTKRISTHSLRVSFATLLFAGGANIRSISELMLHRTLSTTAKYTPIPIADLRRVLLAAHPRA
ncbi:MAG: tyrosine-type recombinase/integrase [Planctomycetes bacterium]|nr:tyrosine-type recombinase/integrase [Planctomycetota bacterium]